MSDKNKNEEIELVIMGDAKKKNEEKEPLSEEALLAIGNLLYATSKGDGELVLRILSRGDVDVDVGDYDKRTALHIAASEGHLEVVKALIERGANVNPYDRWGSTPLDDAIRHNFENIAVFLRENGGTNGQTQKFEVDLIQAAGHGDMEKVTALIKSGTPVNSVDYAKRTALHVAIAERRVDVVKYLLDNGADIHMKDKFGYTPVQEAHRHAVRLGEDDIVELLKERQVTTEVSHHKWYTRFMDPFFPLMLSFQIIIIVLFAVFTEYDHEADGRQAAALGIDTVTKYYAFFMDVHIMIFIGFGFLMTFLRKYGYMSVGINFLLGTMTIEWYLLVGAFFEYVFGLHHGAHISIDRLIKADFCAGSVLITFGALLGKTSPAQMCMIAFLEAIVFSINESVSLKLKIADIGGSYVIHAFGAYFGLAASMILTPSKARGNADNAAVYRSDMFAMIGTIFLWIYWPGFNGAMGVGNTQHRAIVNTVLSISASCVTAFIASHAIRGEKIFNMVDIQNATIAGGVAIGAAADMVLHPAISIGVGTFAGLLSVFGFCKIQSFLESKIKLHDTCGVHNLHGMPGIFGAVVAIVAAAWANTDFYDTDQLTTVFSGRETRTASRQASIQVAFLFITLGFAIVGGLLAGLITKLLTSPKKFFVDDEYWEVPSLELPYYFDRRGEIARDESENPSSRKSSISYQPNLQTESRIASLEKKVVQLLQRNAKSSSNLLANSGITPSTSSLNNNSNTTAVNNDVLKSLTDAITLLAKNQKKEKKEKGKEKEKERKDNKKEIRKVKSEDSIKDK